MRGSRFGGRVSAADVRYPCLVHAERYFLHRTLKSGVAANIVGASAAVRNADSSEGITHSRCQHEQGWGGHTGLVGAQLDGHLQSLKKPAGAQELVGRNELRRKGSMGRVEWVWVCACVFLLDRARNDHRAHGDRHSERLCGGSSRELLLGV